MDANERRRWRYANDPEYRLKVLDRVKRRYHEDPEYRKRALEYAKRRKSSRWPTAKCIHRERLQAIKLAGGCVDCGYRAHAVALDFDHLPGQVKSFGLASACGRYDWRRIIAEIEKCDVVCANCHRVRTQARREESDPQGSPSP